MKFQDMIKRREQTLKTDTRRSNILGYAKVFLVLLLLGGLIYLAAIRRFPPLASVLFAAALVALMILWVIHERVHAAVISGKSEVAVYKQYIDRINGNWTAFKDKGAECIDPEHDYAADLDIVGPKSLFQFLNTTGTWHGRRALIDDLLRPAYNRDEILSRQKAVAELSAELNRIVQARCALSRVVKDASADALAEELRDRTPFTKSKIPRVLITVGPAVTIAFNALANLFRWEALIPYGLLLAAAQLLVWLLGMKKVKDYMGAMLNLKLGAYAEAVKFINNQRFNAPKLIDIQARLRSSERAVKALGGIGIAVSLRGNPIIYFLVNVLLLWDYQCAFSFSDWREKYAPSVEDMFLAVGEFESLLAFAQLPHICKPVCLPGISGAGKVFEARAMGHPLIANEVRVNNDFTLNNSVYLVSGSNMSGKTTFLRTVGVNLILARAGGFVCAETMTCSLQTPVTSMRIADSMGISTFYAELKRVKMILDAAGGDVLFLIDEIFKGTNSTDRLTGAKTVIKKLLGLGAAGLVSTHDLELCELAGIQNVHFSERYENNEILFDYKLKQGKSTTTNARRLMEMVGIVD